MNWDFLQSKYAGKKVFITGHTGFKGSWLSLILNELGATIKGYSLAPEATKNLFNELEINSLIDSQIDDIRDLKTLKKSILEFQPDYVFHMAAQALVLDSYKNPVYTYDTNVMGTVNTLESLKSIEKKCNAVIITTDKVYENLERSEPYSENERLGGFDPYSNSKACAELVTSSYINSFFNPNNYKEHQTAISAVRSGNVIGGGDWSENRIIPDLVKSLNQGDPLIIRNPNAVRPWQHVLEPLGAYLLIGAKLDDDYPKYAIPYNFGPKENDELNVEGLVKTAIKAWGSGSFKIQQNKNQPHEAGLLKLSIKRANEVLNWFPKYNSELAIYKTIQWYKESNGNEKEFTLSQIRDYFKP